MCCIILEIAAEACLYVCSHLLPISQGEIGSDLSNGCWNTVAFSNENTPQEIPIIIHKLFAGLFAGIPLVWPMWKSVQSCSLINR